MSDRDELVARLTKTGEYEPVGHDAWEAARAALKGEDQ